MTTDWLIGCDRHRVNDRHRTLRARWRTASLAAGWPFPSDWATAAVDRVCEALAVGADLSTRLTELGAERADAGIGLAGALQDLAALHAVTTVPLEHTGLISPDTDAVPAEMLRPTALGWADAVAARSACREVEDALTGLTTPAYLRARLREIYRQEHAKGRRADDGYALLTISLDIPEAGWPHTMAMVLVADVLRTVFDSGETLSLLRGSIAAVLTRRDGRLAERCDRVRRTSHDRLANDPALDPARPLCLRVETLPPAADDACDLLTALS